MHSTQLELFAFFRQLLLALVVSAPFTTEVAAQSGSQIPDVAEFNAFIAKQEKAMGAAKKQLLRRIDAEEKAIRRVPIDPDIRSRSLDAIARDREAFESDGKMPNSDELIFVVAGAVDDYQKIADRIEKMRHRWADRAVRVDDPAAMAKFAALEQRLGTIVAGREHFKSGSVWKGKRHSNVGNFTLTLSVHDVTGNNFRGELAQKGVRGRGALMAVEGQFRGNRIMFATTQINRGKDREFGFEGYLLSDRIVALMGGTSAKREAVEGWISLWRTSEPQGRRRRG